MVRELIELLQEGAVEPPGVIRGVGIREEHSAAQRHVGMNRHPMMHVC